MNSYYLISDDFEAIKEEEKNIIKKESFSDYETSIYDMEETTLDNALEDLDTYNFLSSKKLVIIRNIEEVKENENKEKIEHLLKYIDNPSQDNLLIIEARKTKQKTDTEEKKEKSKVNIDKELKKRCKSIEVEINSISFIKNQLKDYKISDKDIKLLDEYCMNDITKIKTECDKLMSYCMDSKKIEAKDIELLVSKKLGDPKDLTFQFTRNLGERNKEKALKDYKELLEYNIEPLQIIGLLSSQLRIIYQVKLLSKKQLSDREIANMLEEKEFRIKKTRELIALYTEEELRSLIQKLSDMDLRIKTTDTSSKNELELFILNI